MNIWIVSGILAAMIAGAAFFYYTSTQSQIQQLTKKNATLEQNYSTLEQANNDNLQVIDGLQMSYNKSLQDFEELQRKFNSIRAQNAQLRSRFDKHQLSAIAAAKPSATQTIINNASSKALRCIELLTGSPLTSKEKEATNGKEFNSECPWLYVGGGSPAERVQ